LRKIAIKKQAGWPLQGLFTCLIFEEESPSSTGCSAL
jgi:hypothetical protein